MSLNRARASDEQVNGFALAACFVVAVLCAAALDAYRNEFGADRSYVALRSVFWVGVFAALSTILQRRKTNTESPGSHWRAAAVAFLASVLAVVVPSWVFGDDPALHTATSLYSSGLIAYAAIFTAVAFWVARRR